MPDDAETADQEHISHDGLRTKPEVPAPPVHPLAISVGALNAKPGDIVIVRGDPRQPPPPAPAGVQVWMLPHVDVQRLTSEDMYRLGWVRRKA